MKITHARQPTIIRIPEVVARTGLSRSTLYLRMADNAFPRQVNLGGRAIGWLESDIDDWITEMVQASRSDPS